MSSRSASTRNAYVYAEDTDEEDLDKIKSICGDVFEASPTGGSLYGELAKRIRALLDKEMGVRGWNVVVGRSFGASPRARARARREGRESGEAGKVAVGGLQGAARACLDRPGGRAGCAGRRLGGMRGRRAALCARQAPECRRRREACTRCGRL